MKTPCILVLEQDFLIKRALASAMGLGYDLEVVVSEAGNAQGLADEVAKLQPDVFVLGESISFATDASLSLLHSVHPALKVVVVSEHNNWLHIFRGEDVLLTSLADLVDTISHP